MLAQALRSEALLGVDVMPNRPIDDAARALVRDLGASPRDAVAAASTTERPQAAAAPSHTASFNRPPQRAAGPATSSSSTDPQATVRAAPEASGAPVSSPAGALFANATAESSQVPPLDARERRSLLEALEAEHAASCPHCTVATGHTRLVFGEGSALATLMFVGEAPGETEDQLGRPFVGRAGQKLDEIIGAMKLRREDVYIANVLKSRPPDNRTPLQHEVEGCGPFLKRQIAIIRPRVIVTLGGPATKLLLEVETGITRLRGVWSSYRDGSLTIPVMPTFHPAYLLRNYTVETRQQVWSDMQAVLVKIAELDSAP